MSNISVGTGGVTITQPVIQVTIPEGLEEQEVAEKIAELMTTMLEVQEEMREYYRKQEWNRRLAIEEARTSQ